MEMAEIERLLGPDAWPWFGPMLIFDCETTTDIGQKLRFGVFQERGLNYRDLVERKRLNGRITREDMDEQRSEGIFYNPATCSETEIETMRVSCRETWASISHAGKIPPYGLLSALLLQTLAGRRPAPDNADACHRPQSAVRFGRDQL